jgi:hypothetical protein
MTSDLNEQYSAVCQDADGNTWEGTEGEWSENDPKGTISDTGLYEAGKVGRWTIKYTENEVDGTTKVTVKWGSPTSIRLTPETWSGTVGDSIDFYAIGIDEDGNERDVTEFTEFTTDDAYGSFNVNTYFPATVGDWVITGEFNEKTDVSHISVNPGPLFEIVLEDLYGNPIDTSSVVVGQTFEVYAKGYDEYGNPLGSISVEWISDDDSVCEVDPESGTSTEITILDFGTCIIYVETPEISNSISLYIPMDSDSDGLADKWEIENFDTLDFDADDDPDEDGISNMNEYIEGTDPMVAQPAEEEGFNLNILIFFIIAIIVVFVVIISLIAIKKK